jgi:outer membrane protein OmpA-like peptidoglycan-associated protein
LVNHLSGFGLFEERTFQEALPLRVSLAAAFETGMKFHLAEKIFLYWGLYCDYGINDIREKKGLEYINRVDGALIGRDFIPNSLIVSHAAPEEAFAKRVVPLSAGLRLRLGFGLGKSKPKAEATDAVSALTPAQKAELEKQRQLDAAEKRRLRGEVADLQQRLADAEQAKQEAETNAQQLADELMALKPTDISDEEFQQDMETIEQSISDVNENDSSAMINYFTNRTEITENQKTKLDAKIAILEKYPNLKIYCIGHTDDIGSDQGNIALGMRRAQGVKDYLVSGGIASERIIVQSRGKSEPLVANTSDFNRARNRRVEITVVR